MNQSETIAIPDPPQTRQSTSPSRPPPGFGANNPAPLSMSSKIPLEAVEARTYTIEQLTSLQHDPNLQEYHHPLPEEINRKFLTGLAKKRRYPFVNERHRKSQENARWKDKKNARSIDDITEEEEHDEARNDNEPDPDWAAADEEAIKMGGKKFQFQALDRAHEREHFAKTGQVPEQPKLAAPEPAPKKNPESSDNTGLESLFRNANLRSLASMPDNAVDAKTLEQGSSSLSQASSSLFSKLPDKGVGSLFGSGSPFDQFAQDRELGGIEMDRDMGDQRKREYGARDLGGRELSSNEIEQRRHELGSRSPNPPARARNQETTSPRIADFDLNTASRLTHTDQPDFDRKVGPNSTSQSPGREAGATPPSGNPEVVFDRKKNTTSSNLDPLQRLENILYDVTDPVRPCVGGQFFAAARPLTNKELYDYSPKFKEIQDSKRQTRHKQMIRHNMQKERQRLMMQKYAQAKKMYDNNSYGSRSGGVGYSGTSNSSEHSDRWKKSVAWHHKEMGYPPDMDKREHFSRSMNGPDGMGRDGAMGRGDMSKGMRGHSQGRLGGYGHERPRGGDRMRPDPRDRYQQHRHRETGPPPGDYENFGPPYQ